MEILNILCCDSIGLTIDNEFHDLVISVNKMENFSFDKIKILFINKLNEIYNPKYPYFFVNIKNFINDTGYYVEYFEDNIKMTIFLQNQNVYKLKFTGITKEPIYSICLSKYPIKNVFNSIIEKYHRCYFGFFKYENYILQMDLMFNLFGLKVNDINEITYIETEHYVIDYSST